MVSILIPAYNVEKYIERCVRSAMNQTLLEIEIIIINDGSTDSTKQIIEKLALEDNRIKVINKKNGGLSSARNEGIKIARGEYIQHLDGDDWLENNSCLELYTLAIQKNLDLVVSDFYKDFDNGKKEIIKSFEFEENKLLSTKCCLEELNKKNINVNIWAKFIKRSLYIENSIEHLEGICLGEDLVTTPKLIGVSKRIMKLNRAYYHYIFNPSSITNNKFSEKIDELFLCFDELEKFFKEKEIDEKYLKVLKANHLANFFYNKPLKTEKYLSCFCKFEKYIDSIDNSVLKELKKMKKYLYLIFKYIKNQKIRINLIVLCSKLNNIQKKLSGQI